MNYYIYCWQHFLDWQGRARRSEFWYFALYNFIVGVVLGIFGWVVGTQIFSDIYGIAVLIPGICVGIRRMHDIGKSGWWILITLIPLIGWIWYIILCCQDSQPGTNQWGSNPKDGQATPPAYNA